MLNGAYPERIAGSAWAWTTTIMNLKQSRTT